MPDLPSQSPAFASGAGGFTSAGPVGGAHEGAPPLPPGPLGTPRTSQPTVPGIIAAGGPLSEATERAVREAAPNVPAHWRRFVAYETLVKVGGSLAWRANNPGNLRSAPTQIGTVPGAQGTFAVFATLEVGRAAQRDLYLRRYGDQSVRAAVERLTPRSENDTDAYLRRLQGAGVDLDATVASQIDRLMPAVEANEGLIPGIEVPRTP